MVVWPNTAIIQPVTMSLGKMIFELGTRPLYNACLRVVEIDIHKGCIMPFPYIQPSSGGIPDNTACTLCRTYGELMQLGLRFPELQMPALIEAAIADINYQNAIEDTYWANLPSPVYAPESPTCPRY